MNILQLVLTISLCFSALIGDYIVFKSIYSDSQTFRAFADSTVHASIGFLSSLLFFSYEFGVTTQARLYNVVFCTILSSLIDIDHFIAAKSFRLKDLINLRHRGIFHCTTLWLFITAVLLLYTHIARKFNIYVLTYMIIIAYASHHIRDANRRGLWMYPFGHTKALNKYLYILILVTLPKILSCVFHKIKPPVYKHTVIQYDSLV